ncbi:MAG: primosomal protein N' [Lachnospiraceae bacterium]|jgi:primosomal protein N' (replication factor Y)|nr:primosomal protein N' [Lachnospiraceae bacterium]
MYADVLIDINHEKLDKTFQYSVPAKWEAMLGVGDKVQVPFGRANTVTEGYILGFSEIAKFDPEKTKDILCPALGSISAESRLIALASWMRETYGGTFIQALKTVLPVKTETKAKEVKTVILKTSYEDAVALYEEAIKKNHSAKARILKALIYSKEGVLLPILLDRAHTTSAALKPLENAGIISLDVRKVSRNPKPDPALGQEKPVLNDEQYAVLKAFDEEYHGKERRPLLIHGVTGSGKTEIYMEMIERVLAEGKDAIMLIPEIALTYQMIGRFAARFGEKASVLHSRLSAGERYDQFERARIGEVKVMIGPRSAIFSPFANLGLIIMDEEHENTYKSEQTPRYHARETALKRAQLEGAYFVMGSATPSVTAYSLAKSGVFRLAVLRDRVMGRSLPKVITVDMREEFKNGNRGIFSNLLIEHIKKRVENRQQVMLFLNRRGYAGFISCIACGAVVKCPHCDVSLTAHRDGKLKCHYCGYQSPFLHCCPVCGSKHVGVFRAGTQQIEAEVKKHFPTARVLRMDADTTSKKDGHEKILSAFRKGDADILVGTQMIVKGHDFENVTLMGIIAADQSLFSADYAAGERTFALLAQAAGRAGRGDESGEVIVQTYNPEHYSIAFAAASDYEGFYEEEINYRRVMGYPPAQNLLAVLVGDEDEEKVKNIAERLRDFVKPMESIGTLQVIGPAAPAAEKIKDVHRRVIYLKAQSLSTLNNLREQMEAFLEKSKAAGEVRIIFDLNPTHS